MHRFWVGLRLFIVAFALFVLFARHEPLAAQNTSPYYYYYQGTRIPLDLNSALVAVRFDPTLAPDVRRNTATASGDVNNFDARLELPLGNVTLLPIRAGVAANAAQARLKSQPGIISAAPVYQVADGTQLIETEEFIARFRPELPAAAIGVFNLANGVTFVRAQPDSDRVMILKPTAGNPRSARELANAYVESGWVEFAEPNFIVRAAQVHSNALVGPQAADLATSDTNFNLQWALKNTRQFFGSVQGDDIKAPQAWGVTQGASSLKIAIIDEGVDASHPDLAGKVQSGINETVQPPNTNTQPSANDHHGTATAGIAAANSNNARGIAGVCWYCQILPVKVAVEDSQGHWITQTSMLAAGIDWAWQNGADVLSNSWTMSAPSDDVRSSIFSARFGGRGGKGSTIVFAAGNDNANTVNSSLCQNPNGSPVVFPACLNNYVIAVGASNWCDQRKTNTNDGCNNNDASWGSNFGNALDLVAPGEAIFTTCNGNDCTNGAYTYFAGTSASTPLVAGAAALLYSLNPNLTPDKVQSVLQTGAKDLGIGGKDNDTGYGRLDANRAILALYNLGISASDNKTFVHANDNITYTLAYSNTGITAMGSTVISVTLPTNTNYLGSTPAFTAQGGGVYQLALGTLGSNATGAATFRVQPQAGSEGQTLTFKTQISGAFPELVMTDNLSSDVSFVVAQDLFLPMVRGNSPP